MLRSLDERTEADGGGAGGIAISDLKESWLVPSAEICQNQKGDFLVWVWDGGWGVLNFQEFKIFFYENLV